MMRRVFKGWIPLALSLCFLDGTATHVLPGESREGPTPLIFDTDIGNDIDDALALALIHALERRGECRLLAVTISKDNLLAARFADLVNTFYGRPDIPIGLVRDGKTADDGKYLRPVVQAESGGVPCYPHDLVRREDAPNPTTLLRRVLAAQPDGSVVIVVVGFSTNLSRLLESRSDEVSPLDGKDLVRRKVRLRSAMAGHFAPEGIRSAKEYNIVKDIVSAQRVYRDWPTEIVLSGWEVGRAIRYPAESIRNDYQYVARHPIREAYGYYMGFETDRPTYDLTGFYDGEECSPDDASLLVWVASWLLRWTRGHEYGKAAKKSASGLLEIRLFGQSLWALVKE